MDKYIQDLMAFLDASPTSYQASVEISTRLEKAGFRLLNETEAWKLVPGGKYYVRRAGTAVLAFAIGSGNLSETGCRIAASHIDSPALRIKPQSLRTEGNVTKIGVEVYGGPILATWTDRELGLAGIAVIRKDGKLTPVPVNLKRPLAIIPNAAIHLNREINNGFVYNKQIHLQAILSTGDNSDSLKEAVAGVLDIKPEDIVDMDLFLYDPTPAALAGIDGSLLVSGRLDNLAMTHAILSSLTEVSSPEVTALGVFFDHEEIGSETLQGAMSSLLAEVLERVGIGLGLSEEQRYLALRGSFLISADMAHAFHPAYAEKYDPDYAPKMNQGPVIKINGSQRYATTASSGARFASLCASAGVACQKFMTRSDMPCGSTVGPLVSSRLGIPAVDIGNPMWAMHSIRETCGVADHLSLISVLRLYFDQK
jgi:aspartyl aminopeptidase